MRTGHEAVARACDVTHPRKHPRQNRWLQRVLTASESVEQHIAHFSCMRTRE